RRLDGASRHHLADSVDARPEVGEAVVAVAVRGRGGEGGAVPGQLDGHPGHAGVGAAVVGAVGVQVVELGAVDVDQGEVAEVPVGDVGAAGGLHGVQGRQRSLHVAGGDHLADPVGARPEVGEAVGAVGGRGGVGL